jgi:hypothetical protein
MFIGLRGTARATESHILLTEKTFRHADGFSGIPAGPGDRLFMDILPVQHTDGAI